jgi:hypothetical protein
MSAWLARALIARRPVLSICILALVFICVNEFAIRAEAKGSSLFSYHRPAGNVVRSSSVGGLVGLKRTEVVKEEIVNCTKITEGEAVTVECHGETFYAEEQKDKPGSAAFFRDLFLCIFLVLTAGSYSHYIMPLYPNDSSKAYTNGLFENIC